MPNTGVVWRVLQSRPSGGGDLPQSRCSATLAGRCACQLPLTLRSKCCELAYGCAPSALPSLTARFRAPRSASGGPARSARPCLRSIASRRKRGKRLPCRRPRRRGLRRRRRGPLARVLRRRGSCCTTGRTTSCSCRGHRLLRLGLLSCSPANGWRRPCPRRGEAWAGHRGNGRTGRHFWGFFVHLWESYLKHLRENFWSTRLEA